MTMDARIFLSILVVCGIVLIPKAVATLTQEERIEILGAHNDLRRMLTKGYEDQPVAGNMLHMYWNSQLEALAQAWSLRCKPEHGSLRGLLQEPEMKDLTTANGAYIGQNILLGTGNWLSLSQVVEWFFNESRRFNFENSTSYDCTKPNGCGHYTQVAWADSFLVGCGRTRCNGNDFVTCQYSPAGNIEGCAPFKIGKPCKRCRERVRQYFTKCEDGLCVPSPDRCSVVTECTVVDRENCLCSPEHYDEFVARKLNSTSIDEE